MYDAGQHSIDFYNYDLNKIVTIKSSGEIDIKNNSKNIKEIEEILKKYDIEVTYFGEDELEW